MWRPEGPLPRDRSCRPLHREVGGCVLGVTGALSGRWIAMSPRDFLS